MKKKLIRKGLVPPFLDKKCFRIMRLTFILMFVGLMQVSASLYSQTTRLNLSMKDSRLEDVLQAIEKQSEFRFAYSVEYLDIDKHVNIDMKNMSIEKVLDELFKDSGIKYKIFERHIMLYEQEGDLNNVVQQTKVVSGKVTDQSGSPLPGVTVVVKGTTQGTITDVDGNYTLSNVTEDAILVFSFVGMKTQEMPVAGKSQIDVVMAEETIGLNEVVAIGYGTMKKSDLTGSVISANIEAFQEAPNVNIMQSLQGSVPGIQIGQVDRAGEEPSIQIRGVNTLSGNKSPLIIVDEIIYSGRIGDLNPSDIQSIEILKDASSKAIYGSQAANGVILITTKIGKATRKPVFNYSGSVSFQAPTVNARLLNAEENLEKIRSIYYERAYLAPDYITPNPDFGWATSTELVPNILEGIANGVDFDWYDELTSTAQISDHVLSVNGGTDKTTYYLSGGYTGQDGYVINDQYKRYTARINMKSSITNWLTIGVNSFGSFTDFSGVGPGGFVETSPFITPYDENDELLIYPKGASTTHLNPLLAVQADNKNLGNNISGLFYADIDVPKVEGLSYRINYHHSLTTSENFTSNPYGASLTGSISKIHASRGEETLDNIVTYDRQFNDHGVKATLVYGYRKAAYNSTNAQGENVPNISLSYNSLEQALTQQISSTAWDESSLYQMARVNYNFKNRYLVTGTFRRDGYSGFAQNNKFATFPSGGIGWVLSNEPFYDIPAVEYLKLRVSYGQNGNQTSRYSSLASVSAIDDYKYVFGDGGSSSMGQSIVSLSNADLKWEKTAGLNFGIDFKMLNNRINGNIEYYKTTTTDLLWNMVIPEVTGFSSIKTNIGEVANSGFEFYIEAIPIKTNDFSWDFGINFSTNKNKIVSLLGYDNDNDGREDDLIASGLFIGKSIGAIYHYEIDGIYQVGDDIPTGYHPGNYRIVDQNEDDKITADEDRIFIGRTEPAFIAGIQNNLKYKNFTLRFFINTIQGGKDGYLGSQSGGAEMSSTGNYANSNNFTFFDYWSPTNSNGKYAVTVKSPQINPTPYYSRSFIRLQDISLAYNFDRSRVQNFGIEGLKIYVSGKNLLTLTDWDGWDPETNQGIASGYYPVMKSLTLGVDIEF